MKVLTFIEWYYKNTITNELQDKVYEVANFYNQPFTVDMLVNNIPNKDIKPENFEDEQVYAQCLDAYHQSESLRLFDGWIENLEIGKSWYDCKDGLIYFGKEYIIINTFIDREFYKPRTLNDFITLCNLAGIELQWNESNPKVKEMFK